MNYPLSSFRSNSLSSSLQEVEFLQFRRTYSGNYSFNFPLVLSGCNDLKTKNFSNFYLTSNKRLSESITNNSEEVKTSGFQTNLIFGTSYLGFFPIDPEPYAIENRINEVDNYGAYGFIETPDETTKFTLSLKDDNFCHIIFSKNFIDYYLATDEENEIFFTKKKILNFSEESINSQDFKYIFSEDRKFLLLYQIKENGSFQIIRNGNSLEMVPVSSSDVSSSISNYIKIDRNFYTDPYPNLNTSFITYNNDDNLIDNNFSKFDLDNNLIIHKTYSDKSKAGIIVLKNQLPQTDIFSCGANLLSSEIPVGDLRNYTSIFEDINEETSEDLELNYVFYDKFYNVKPGDNYFTSPSSMYPFEILNINDTKFVDCGAFSFTTPELADKVHKLDTNENNLINGQAYLCTWLSGNPTSREKIWVDRYYYPDVITKQEAISSKPIYSLTYQEAIENLIATNSNLRENVIATKIFDKKSDLTFAPNENFIYKRLNPEEIDKRPEIIKICNCALSAESLQDNYFKTLNQSGQFTFGFYFTGDPSTWIIESNRNNINGGLRFTKGINTIHCSFILYNSSNGGYSTYEVEKNFKHLKENFIYVSIDAINGQLYFYLNNEVIQKWDIPLAQFYGKNILFGDFSYIENDTTPKRDVIFDPPVNISNVILINSYVEDSFAFYLQLSNGKIDIQNIQISLPCGMRNSTDKIDILNSVCGSSIFKSGKFDVIVKNVETESADIIDIIRDTITSGVVNETPPTSELNNINFENFK